EPDNIVTPLQTNINEPLEPKEASSRRELLFLVSSSKKVSTNTAGQSTDQNLDVNNDVSNKQTSSSAIEMIIDEQDDDTNQFHKLENNKIIAILKVPINSSDNIDEYKKFMKIVQNSILEDSMLKQEDIIEG
ncbi:15276_t:CDS:2, partial [Rhizophagus irregularis]